jgi:hypothetical protein
MFTSYKQLLVKLEGHFTIMSERILVRGVRLPSPAIPSPCVYKRIWKLVTLTKFIYRMCTTAKFELTFTQSTVFRFVHFRFSRRFGTAFCLLLRGNGNWFRWMLDNLSNQHSLWTLKNSTRSKSQVPTIKVWSSRNGEKSLLWSVHFYYHKPGEKS